MKFALNPVNFKFSSFRFRQTSLDHEVIRGAFFAEEEAVPGIFNGGEDAVLAFHTDGDTLHSFRKACFGRESYRLGLVVLEYGSC